MLYLDNAATTVLAPEVAEQFSGLLRQPWANPASQHRAGRQAQAALEDAKDRIKAICTGSQRAAQLQAWQLIVTSGGTEANNLALHGLVASPHSPLIVSSVEHPSVLTMAAELQAQHTRPVHLVPVDAAGQVNIDALDALLAAAGPAPLISIMVANNETGIIHNVPRIAQVCRAHGGLLHCDAVQAMGKLPVEQFVPWCDAFTVAAHKLHGPLGVGALVVRSSISVRPMLLGGGQQLGLRPGTESVPLVCAMAEACDLAERLRAGGCMQHVEELRLRFESDLIAAGIGAEVIGAESERLPHISLIAFPGLDRQALLMALDLAGIACSAGSACASGSSQNSHVLTAMDLPPLWVAGAIRFSFSRFSTGQEVDEAASRICDVINRLRKRVENPNPHRVK